MMTGPGNLAHVRRDARRLAAAVDTVLTPGERLASTAIGWAAQLRPRVPLVFLGRRQYWFALTDRRLLVFGRRRGGPTAEDLVLGKRYAFFTLERTRRLRPLFQLRIRGANDSRLVLEFRPRQRSVAAELAARLTPSPGAGGTDPGPAEPPTSRDVDRDAAPQEDAQAEARGAQAGEGRAQAGDAQQAEASTATGTESATETPDPDRDTAVRVLGRQLTSPVSDGGRAGDRCGHDRCSHLRGR